MNDYKSYKIRLEPNNEQRSMFLQHSGVARHAYNKGLAYCNELFKNGEKIPNAIDLHKWLVAVIKKEFPWYYDSSKCSPQQALRDLDGAFKNFHRMQKQHNYSLKDKKGRLKGLPNFKKRGIKDSFYLEGSIRFEENKIKLPVIGWIKLSENIGIKEIKNCVISRTADQWHVSFRTEREKEFTIKKFDHVGVDLGIKTLATLSTGEVFENLKPYKNAKKKLRKQQKEVSRRFVEDAESQSKNYKKSVNKLAKTHATVANVRKDCIHKITTYLAKNFETVIIEDLKPKNMSKNHNLASAILDGGFYEFKRQLLYKKRWYGGKLLVANQFYPSSKLCSCCKNKKSDLKLSDRTYVCDICGYIGDRDLNSGINLDDLNKLAVSSIVLALGDESPTSQEVQLVDELGMKHQLYIFV